MFGISQRRVFDWASELTAEESSSNSEDAEDSCSNSCFNSKETSPSPNEASTSEPPAAKKSRLEADLPNQSAQNVEAASPSAVNIDSETGSSKKLKRRTVVQIQDEAIDMEIFEWAQSQLPRKPSSTEIRNKAREMFRSKGYDKIQCSYGWYRRWAERYNLSHGYHDESDLAILEWVLQEFDNNEILTYEKLQEFAQSTISKAKPSFKASSNWVNRFLKRHHVLIHWDTQFKGSLPSQLESQAQAFLEKLNSANLGIATSNICAMDEIPLYFSSNSLYAQDELLGTHDSEARPTRLRKSSIKHCEATVILALLADGTLMPPMIIVKSQSKSNTNQVYTKKDNPLVAFYSQSTEPSRASLEKWFDLVWRKNITLATADATARSSLLLWDAYQVHAQLQPKCDQLGIHCEAFPLGSSLKLQPINVFARKTFLKHIEDDWVKYMGQNMSATDITWPSTNEIVDWVYASYLTLKNMKDTLRQSFEAVGFRFL